MTSNLPAAAKLTPSDQNRAEVQRYGAAPGPDSGDRAARRPLSAVEQALGCPRFACLSGWESNQRAQICQSLTQIGKLVGNEPVIAGFRISSVLRNLEGSKRCCLLLP